MGVAPAAPTRLSEARVIDLSSLWAGPLCGRLLVAGGADVVKVEAVDRPDGARLGPAGFFDLLNAGKRSVALDLRTDEGRRQLATLISRADIVIEASRPRALSQMGIDAHRALTGSGPTVWVSITGHGRRAGNRVGFGDDAAVEGGLVSWDDDGPCFCADAVADPITGLTAAAAAVDALATGGRWLLDVAMSDVARSLAGPTLPIGERTQAGPRRRAAGGRAPLLGEHTDEVLAMVGP
jgi:crotonobetainyl-CoA:carnitine CoA-transferase CaiB-like acyl-CoA transferase